MTHAAQATAVLSARAISVERAGRSILRDFTLHAHAGQVVALTGPNGAGKSTALRALAGLISCAGEVQLLGRVLSAWPLRERARAVSYVPQQSELQLGLGVREVVSQGRYAHATAWPGLRSPLSAAVERALADTDSTALAARRYDELSGGEQRRVLLARALATEAPIILLDEPTLALDIAHSLRFLALLRALARAGRTMVVVLHDLQQVRRYADCAVLLDRGRVVVAGVPDSVITSEHVRAVYGVELQERADLGFSLTLSGGGTAP